MATTYKKPLRSVVIKTINGATTVTVADTTTSNAGSEALLQFMAKGIIAAVNGTTTTYIPYEAIDSVAVTTTESDEITRADAVCDEESTES